MFLHYIAKRSS